MTPETLALVLGLVEVAVQEEPTFAASMQKLFSKGTPTKQDFADTRAAIAAEDYSKFVPASALPPDPPTVQK